MGTDVVHTLKSKNLGGEEKKIRLHYESDDKPFEFSVPEKKEENSITTGGRASSPHRELPRCCSIQHTVLERLLVRGERRRAKYPVTSATLARKTLLRIGMRSKTVYDYSHSETPKERMHTSRSTTA